MGLGSMTGGETRTESSWPGTSKPRTSCLKTYHLCTRCLLLAIGVRLLDGAGSVMATRITVSTPLPVIPLLYAARKPLSSRFEGVASVRVRSGRSPCCRRRRCPERSFPGRPRGGAKRPVGRDAGPGSLREAAFPVVSKPACEETSVPPRSLRIPAGDRRRKTPRCRNSPLPAKIEDERRGHEGLHGNEPPEIPHRPYSIRARR